MANTDAMLGFTLHKLGGARLPRYVEREADSTLALAVGDAYHINGDGKAARADAEAPDGIVAGIVLQAKSGEGPESLDYIPAGTVGAKVIGIEDDTVEFEVQCSAALTLANFDTNAKVDVVDTAPDATLRQSRQEVGNVGGSHFYLVRKVDREGNAYGADQKVVVRLAKKNT